MVHGPLQSSNQIFHGSQGGEGCIRHENVLILIGLVPARNAGGSLSFCEHLKSEEVKTMTFSFVDSKLTTFPHCVPFNSHYLSYSTLFAGYI